MLVVGRAAWLKNKRKELNITQDVLAEEANVSLGMISKLEQEQRGGSKEIWDKLYAYFGERYYDEDDIYIKAKRDKQIYGGKKQCYMVYTFNENDNNNIIFIEYGLVNDKKEVTDKIEEGLKVLSTTIDSVISIWE